MTNITKTKLQEVLEFDIHKIKPWDVVIIKLKKNIDKKFVNCKSGKYIVVNASPTELNLCGAKYGLQSKEIVSAYASFFPQDLQWWDIEVL